MTCGSMLGSIDIAFWIPCTISPGSGSANTTMSSGKTYSKGFNIHQPLIIVFPIVSLTMIAGPTRNGNS